MRGVRLDLQSGSVLAGPLVSCPAPSIVELFGYVGFDFVLIDSEQSPTSSNGPDLEGMVRAAYAADVAPMVRVSDNVESQINNALNLGAQAVWVPHIETAAAAAEAVRSFHYSPRGARGAAPIVRGARYGLEPWEDYRARADRENVLVVIVESVKGLDAIEEIAAVDGVDAICFGPFDMAVDAGLKAQDFYGARDPDTLHPFLRDAGDRVLDACRRHGRIPATAAWSPAMGRGWIASGYRLLLYGLDFALFGRAAQALKAEIDSLKLA